MYYLITKTIDKRFTYYLNKNGSWEGLKDNAQNNFDYGLLSDKLLKLRAKNMNCKIDFIDVEKSGK